MIPSGLDFKQAPPISVPLRFFVTAPAFAILAALIGLWQGPELYASRWSPSTLAATHLLTLGFAAMVMVGALMQIMPVLAGAPIPWPRSIAAVVHGGLTLGTLALAGGFLTGEPALLGFAVALLGSAFTIFLAAMATSLARVRLVNESVRMLRLVAVALAVTAVLGLWLAASRGWGIALPEASMRDIHPAWGFLGWTGLLVAGVASRVVPMFQMTPAYPAWMPRRLGLALFAALAAWSIAVWRSESALAIAGTATLAALYATFAATTLWLQRRRRRRLPDVNLLFWRAGMLSAAAASLLWLASSFWRDAPSRLALFLGVLTIVGATLSVISGMLYKIVPFLAWFHLQARTGMGRQVPHVTQYLADHRQRRHLWLHVLSLLLLLAASAQPALFARAAALVFALSASHLLLNLLTIVRTYERQLGILQSAAIVQARRDAGPA